MEEGVDPPARSIGIPGERMAKLHSATRTIQVPLKHPSYYRPNSLRRAQNLGSARAVGLQPGPPWAARILRPLIIPFFHSSTIHFPDAFHSRFPVHIADCWEKKYELDALQCGGYRNCANQGCAGVEKRPVGGK